MRHIYRVFERRKWHQIGKLIAGLHTASANASVAIQAADLLAWTTNRAYTRGDSYYYLLPRLTLGLRHKLLLHDEIVERFKIAADATERGASASAARLNRRLV
jgi:hypothetical protein